MPALVRRIAWIDVAPHLGSGVAPAHLHERPLIRGDDPSGGVFAGSTTEIARVGTFWTPDGPLTDPHGTWSMTASGAVVVVPVHGYRAGAKALAQLAAAAFDLGAGALEQLRRHTAARPVELVLACGDAVTELDTDFRFYLGLTVRVED